MFWDRFDICEAYYLFFCDYHGGQDSNYYKRMSMMSEAPLFFKPAPSLSFETLTENGKFIYLNLENKLEKT